MTFRRATLLSDTVDSTATTGKLDGAGKRARVDVTVVDLDRDQRELPDLAATLSEAERERAGQLRSDVQRRRYVTGRAALREVLAARLNVEPSAVKLAAGEHGKPFVIGGPAFNVGHSRELALIAVTDEAPTVGVDVEWIRRDRPVESLIEGVLSPSERRGLANLSGDALVDAFHWCWTAKEAYLKALGDGLTQRLDRFDVSVDLAGPVEVVADRGERPLDPCALERLAVAGGYAAAVAVAAPACEPHITRWREPLAAAADDAIGDQVQGGALGLGQRQTGKARLGFRD